MLIRRATMDDLPEILRLLFDDRATPSNETDPGARCYSDAFAEMQRAEWNGTYVAEVDGRIVGTFMLTFIRHLLRQGALVAQIEAVRVDASERGRGYGAEMMRWAIDAARRRGCSRMQLTSNKSRRDAHRFYERLGFRATHEGMKLALDDP
ncbi:MAG TPA: GNAT family N-acetyltransferase [Myxococcales bacterium]|jgi:GNAT superfamily N-acetyltransferase|nr:GNAT family N-acetyltransferase [Myxococcales bacterium]